MRDKVVDGTALNSKWIPMALNGFFDSGDGPMLSFTLPGERSWWTAACFLQNGTGS